MGNHATAYALSTEELLQLPLVWRCDACSGDIHSDAEYHVLLTRPNGPTDVLCCACWETIFAASLAWLEARRG